MPRKSKLQKTIAAALAEPVVPEYTFRGGYIEDASGDRWWSAELLAKIERERDEARAEIERLKRRFDAQWQECHDGSKGACCKAHE